MLSSWAVLSSWVLFFHKWFVLCFLSWLLSPFVGEHFGVGPLLEQGGGLGLVTGAELIRLRAN